MASGHVKSPSASTSHEGHMAKFHPLIHSASSDKGWAIRAVAARLDKLWVVSELLKTDFPPGEPSAARVKGAKRLLALADDNWDPWTNIGLADEQLETSLIPESQAPQAGSKPRPMPKALRGPLDFLSHSGAKFNQNVRERPLSTRLGLCRCFLNCAEFSRAISAFSDHA